MTSDEFSAALERLGLSWDQAANLLGVNRTSVWRWQNGSRPVPGMVANFLAYVAATRQQKAGKALLSRLMTTPTAARGD